jgi:endonuclease/exonuclease/phosphatase (EEP) superfamily protein YafD
MTQFRSDGGSQPCNDKYGSIYLYTASSVYEDGLMPTPQMNKAFSNERDEYERLKIKQNVSSLNESMITAGDVNPSST